MKILIDNGHGSDTPGKRSPNGTFLEYRYNRIIAARSGEEVSTGAILKALGEDAEKLPLDGNAPFATDFFNGRRYARYQAATKFTEENC